jgi:hypothetical protein
MDLLRRGLACTIGLGDLIRQATAPTSTKTIECAAALEADTRRLKMPTSVMQNMDAKRELPVAVIGYARVSTDGQTLDDQVREL